MNECHDGAYPDYDIRERYPDDIIHPDDLPYCDGDDDDDDEVNPNSDVNEDEVEGVSIVVESEEIITISDDDDDVIIEYLPDVIELVQSTPETTEALKQPKICLELEKKNQEKKIVLKEKPNRIIKRPYNLANKCELTGNEEEENEDIYYYSMKLKRKVKLQCEGRNMMKIYKEIPCQSSTDTRSYVL